MAKRHSDALAINEGACNPSGIAHSIVEACKEIRAEPRSDTDKMQKDPALRLMVNQLSFIVGNGEMPMTAWDECVAACRNAKYAGAMPDGLFRTLSPEEEAEARQWARENHSATAPEGFSVMHPVVRDEWRKLDGGS
jgi:hypothetical protein